MPDYNNGKIYKIWSPQTELVYIGSTTQSLNMRMAGHKKDYKRFLNSNYGCNSSFEIIQYGDAKIELFENYPCNNKEELNKREGEIIREIKCVNKRVPCRTDKEWRNEHKELIAERGREYHKKNKLKISQRDKLKVECECGRMVRKRDMARHKKSLIHNK